MSDTARIIDAVIAGALVAPLEAAGYQRSARTWRRVGATCVRVVNAQGSAWNTGAEGRFTLNLGLYFPALAPLVGWGRVAERPTEPECQVRMRIGYLLPEGLDHWWIVTPDADVSALAIEVRTAWEHFGAPWLEAHDNLEAARPLVAKQYAYGAAAVSLALGDRADAERRLAEALASCSQRHGANMLRAWARQHGFLAMAT
jgi:hypothetical protein